MKTELKEQLAEKLQKVNQIPFINHGGCGVVAVSVYNWLVRRGENCKIYTIGDRSLKCHIQNNEAHSNVANDHLVVRWSGFYIDSRGLFIYRKEVIFGMWTVGYFAQTPLPLVHKWLDAKDMWNPRFDRQKFEKEIIELFND